VDSLRVILKHEQLTTSLTCRGDLTSHTVDEFDDAARLAVGTMPEVLELDLRGISTMSLQGVFALLRVARNCSGTDTSLKVIPSPIVADVLDRADLSWLQDVCELEIDEDREVALRRKAYRRIGERPYVP
jgi:anti-anti-sigma regulatory factor